MTHSMREPFGRLANVRSALVRLLTSPLDVQANGLAELPAAARRDLLRVLNSPSDVRADVIRQFHERGDAGMVDVLSDLEADEMMRFQVIELLRSLEN